MIFVLNIIITIISPNANRNAYKSVIKSLTTYTVFFNSNSKKLGNFIVLKCSLKAISNNGTLSFPSVSIVELKNCNELINICEISHINIYVVDGLSLRCFTGIIMTTKFNNRITCNCKCASNLHRVTKLVLNFESNCVLACAKNNVTLCGKHIAVDRGFYNNSVNCNLTGGKVKSRVICNGCGECNVVTVDNLAVIKRNCNVRCRICRICNSRKNSIIYSRAIVKSDIINVECKLSGSCGLYISTNEGRRAGVCYCCVGIHCRKVKITGNINGHVYPTRFGNIRFSSRV